MAVTKNQVLKQTIYAQLYQVGVLMAVAVSAFVMVHWLAVRPVLTLPTNTSAFLVSDIFRRIIEGSPFPSLVSLLLFIAVIGGLLALALAATLAIRVPEQKAARELAVSFSVGPLSVAYFLFIKTHPIYLAYLGLNLDPIPGLIADSVGYFAFLTSIFLFVRFFSEYPRPVSIKQVAKYTHAIRSLYKVQAKGNIAWFRLWQLWLDTKLLNQKKIGRLKRYALLSFWCQYKALRAPSALYWIAAIASLISICDWLIAQQFSHSDGILIGVLKGGLLGIVAGALIDMFSLHKETALPDDRKKIDWIASAFFVSALLCLVLIGFGLLGFFWVIFFDYTESQTLQSLSAFSGTFDPGLFLVVPMFFGAFLSALICICSVGMSIFYRGAIDPRLAARKITVFGVLGIVIAILFIFIERTIAAKIVAFLGLAPDFGAFLAGAAVAATVAPVKNRADILVTRFFSRYLPLDSMIDGDRLMQVIAISDLTGYTALSASDEKQALLLAALLQRLSGKLVHAHGGRIVKSMGDAVLFAFDEANTAVMVLTKLHQSFASVADSAGLSALPVRSGAHLGVVVVAHDGDVYGQTVNIAARIQGSAVPHQIVISDSVAQALQGVDVLALGHRRFKNVPEDISCFELPVRAPALSAGVQS